MVIVEGIESTWHYHLADEDSYISYCGRKVMLTSIPLSNWNSTPENYHIPEKWCAKCWEYGQGEREGK